MRILFATDGSTGAQALIEQRHRVAAEQCVHAAAELLRSAGFEAVETVRAGHPADAIMTHAITCRPDLIVLGTRGRSGLRRRLVGSVSGKIARYAPNSVLVARTAGPIRSILLGYDASPGRRRGARTRSQAPPAGGQHERNPRGAAADQRPCRTQRRRVTMNETDATPSEVFLLGALWRAST